MIRKSTALCTFEVKSLKKKVKFHPNSSTKTAHSIPGQNYFSGGNSHLLAVCLSQCVRQSAHFPQSVSSISEAASTCGPSPISRSESGFKTNQLVAHTTCAVLHVTEQTAEVETLPMPKNLKPAWGNTLRPCLKTQTNWTADLCLLLCVCVLIIRCVCLHNQACI